MDYLDVFVKTHIIQHLAVLYFNVQKFISKKNCQQKKGRGNKNKNSKNMKCKELNEYRCV